MIVDWHLSTVIYLDLVCLALFRGLIDRTCSTGDDNQRLHTQTCAHTPSSLMSHWCRQCFVWRVFFSHRPSALVGPHARWKGSVGGEGHPLGFTNRKAENKEKDDGLSILIRDILVEEPVESSKRYFTLPRNLCLFCSGMAQECSRRMGAVSNSQGWVSGCGPVCAWVCDVTWQVKPHRHTNNVVTETSLCQQQTWLHQSCGPLCAYECVFLCTVKWECRRRQTCLCRSLWFVVGVCDSLYVWWR